MSGRDDDLHQRHARAVEVDIAHGRMLVVHQLARVLLDMDALDADLLDAVLVLLVEQNLDLARPDQRVVELRNLIALRQVGVEVILAVEPAPAVDHRVQRHAGAHRLADAFAVGHRQHARHRRVDQATWVLGSAPNAVAAPEKSLALETTWAWTSRPTTTSQSPVAPLMR